MKCIASIDMFHVHTISIELSNYSLHIILFDWFCEIGARLYESKW